MATYPAPSRGTPVQLNAGSAWATENLRVVLLSDPPGVVRAPAVSRTSVCLHVGAPTYMRCRRGRQSHSGTAIHGDIDIIPAGTPSEWQLREKDQALILSVAQRLLHAVAEESGVDPRQLEIRNRFQARDPQMEHIGWAMKAEMDRGYPCGRLYMESLATALAAHLVRHHSSVASEPRGVNAGISGQRLKQVVSFIEENLADDLSLPAIATVSGLSVSHFKTLFRRSVGLPVHQYVIRRRVERAALLLRESRLGISEIALETGFAHQSHLALHMRRVLGISPRAVREDRL
ncbi:MAG TPA: AraC family transcriptional regulator [Verrucomicrobiae bacterium]|jgi:AraC family transcriptional regulator|nr:AraC family transcriptional regulator [Verrucomicrobiae bacterium]